MNNKRLNYVDIARGISIISILVSHLGYKNINRVLLTFNLPLFLLISGYFFKEQGFKDIFAKKKKTLLYPYVIVCLVIVALSLVKQIFRNVLGIKEGSILNEAGTWIYASIYGSGLSYNEPFYIKQIGPIWYLLALFIASIIFNQILKLNKKYRPVLIAALFMIGYFSARYLFWLPFSIQSACCFQLYLYVGYLYKNYKESFDHYLHSKLVIVLVVFIWMLDIVLYKGFYLSQCVFSNGILDIVGSICGSVIVLSFSYLIGRKDNYTARFLSFCGKYSIYFLCAHAIDIDLIPWSKMIGLFISNSNVCLILGIVCEITWCLLITYLCAKYINKFNK